MCFLRSIEMGLYAFIIALQIVNAYSTSKIAVQHSEESLTIAAANIVDKCFESSERWSELLIISDHLSCEISGKIHRASKTPNSIVFLNSANSSVLTDQDYLNTSVEWQQTKPTAVIIIADSINQLVSVISFLKNNNQRIWRPESYFVIVIETSCDLVECNDMFRFIWDYWILNAVILCSSNDTVIRNQSGIELYTFNPYSGDHSRQWETVIRETVEVSIIPGNFNHSWYIFKQNFNVIRSFEYCGNLFFDKTSNLDGYVIPISFYNPEFLLDTTESAEAKFFMADSRTLKSISTKLRFNVSQVVNHDVDIYGQLNKNGSYSGMMGDVYTGRSHLMPVLRVLNIFPGLGMTYPHEVYGACFFSRIVGIRPQWMNLAEAKYIWIACLIGILFSTVVLYMQNKSNGIASAFLDAERLFIGSSIIHTTTVVKHRIILGSIFLVVLVVDGAIRGRFISILTRVRPYPNLDTVEQLVEQGVDLYGHDSFREMILSSELKLLYKSCVKMNECIESLERMEHQRACLTECKMLPVLTSNSSIIHGASTPIWESYVTFVATMHWPMTNRYSLEVQKLVEAGIIKKWVLDMQMRIEMDGWKVKRTAESAYIEPTKLEDLLPAFVLLFVGVSVALVVFTWEIKDTGE